MEDFDDDLRTATRRVAVDGEKVCFIFDESNILSSGFIDYQRIFTYRARNL
jgi:dynein heavy chain 1